MPSIDPSYYGTPCEQHGHKFTSRFSKIAPSAKQLEEAGVEDWTDEDDACQVIEALFSHLYICDICEVCGMTVGTAASVAPVAAPAPAPKDTPDVP